MDDKEIGRIWGGMLPEVEGQQRCRSNMRDDLSLDTRKVQIRYVYS